MDPYAYQEEDIQRIVSQHRMLLGHKMGLGKSRIFIEACRRLQANRILVVCPNRLRDNFAREITKWYPEAPVTVLRGSNPQKLFSIMFFTVGFMVCGYEAICPITDEQWQKIHEQNEIRVQKGKNPIQHTDLIPALLKVPWQIIGFDEAHRLANRKSLQSLGAKKLAKVAQSVVLMSGTFLRNRVTDIWHPLHLAHPKTWSSYWKFAQKHAAAHPGKYGWEESRQATNEKALAAEIEPVLITRDNSVAPLKREPQTVWVDLEGEQLRVYKEMEERMMAEIPPEGLLIAPICLSQIVRLKQITSYPPLVGLKLPGAKLEALIETCDSTDERILVFTQFASAVEEIADALNRAGISATWMRGSGKLAEDVLESRLQKFQSGSEEQVLVLSTYAGGEGLTLTAASTVIFLDKLFVPAANKQALARADRIGQTRPVLEIHIRAAQTIEDWIESILEDKDYMTMTVEQALIEWKRRKSHG